MSRPANLYATYDQVPTLRKQWFFWLSYFVFQPLAIGILVTGDVYYPKNGEVHSFGIANRIVAGLTALFWIASFIHFIATGRLLVR